MRQRRSTIASRTSTKMLLSINLVHAKPHYISRGSCGQSTVSRSKHGAVHISPTYLANQMDAKLMIEWAKWALLEAIQLFTQAPAEEAAKIRFDDWVFFLQDMSL